MSPLGDSAVFCFPVNYKLLLLVYSVGCSPLLVDCWHRVSSGRMLALLKAERKEGGGGGGLTCINMTALLPWQENNTHAVVCVWSELLFQASVLLLVFWIKSCLDFVVVFFPHKLNVPCGSFKGQRGGTNVQWSAQRERRRLSCADHVQRVIRSSVWVQTLVELQHSAVETTAVVKATGNKSISLCFSVSTSVEVAPSPKLCKSSKAVCFFSKN